MKESELEPGTKGFEIVLRLDWSKLGAALCDAFGLNRREMNLPISGTRQIGSWSGGAVPVILTIQTDRNLFRYVICELALRLRTPFILVGPTSNHMDVACHELLSNALAGFFPLSDHVLMTEHGSLRLRGSGAELFRSFTPPSNQTLNEDSTIKAFAFVKTLDPSKTFKHPSPATVFSYYCIDGLSISVIARKCRCSRGTIINRLKFILKHTGVDPKATRRLSISLESGSEQFSDSRARYINRKRLIDDANESEGEG
jgi:hypothetical protein